MNLNESDPDDYDYEAARAEASASWLEEQVQFRLKHFYAERPAVFAADGELLPEITTWVRRFLAHDAAGMLLIGNVGVGKSWSLWKIKETLIKAGFRGGMEIKTGYDLKQLLTPPVNDVAFNDLATVDILALDDLGSIRVSDWDADHLMGLLDTRWAFQRPTLVASNNPKLRDLLGERVSSRIQDGAHVVKMIGADRRRSK
ncbi:hypothetical protein ACIBCT_20885 [Streptosporangium sp. NPDC050855]|uniref:hypothetical protein n=1 Tax=Streptosporangium sp. NPDC050855 TaxID=3366194 RepID=UPI00378E8A0E